VVLLFWDRRKAYKHWGCGLFW